MENTRHQGAIVLVAGPSGAGKDTVLSYASTRLASDARFVFARRLITRVAASDAEDYEACSQDTFDAVSAAGGLALCWRAHGSSYGIRRSIVNEIGHGRIVIANVSRRIIADGLRLAPRSLIVHVMASPEVLARRLHGRGRETASDIAARLYREAPQLDYGERLLTINNDGPIEQAGSSLLKALLALAEVS